MGSELLFRLQPRGQTRIPPRHPRTRRPQVASRGVLRGSIFSAGSQYVWSITANAPGEYENALNTSMRVGTKRQTRRPDGVGVVPVAISRDGTLFDVGPVLLMGRCILRDVYSV